MKTLYRNVILNFITKYAMRLFVRYNKVGEEWHIKNRRMREVFPRVPDCDNTHRLFPNLDENKAKKYLFIALECDNNWRPLCLK